MSVIYCLNPACPQPENDTKTKICRACNSSLILHRRYVAIKKIGKGGFGTTYLAVDLSKGTSNQYCVIKQLDPPSGNPEACNTAMKLFEREAKTMAKLNHPQIPKLLDYFGEGQHFYLVQDFILGIDLEKEVKKKGVYPETLAKRFLREVLPVLKYIHSQKVIHRDIKPGNILREKNTGKLVLIDFGAVKDQVNTQLMDPNSQNAFTKISVGTMGFAPPEQLAMRPTYASDIYALAATCLYLMTGKAPKDLCNNVTGELAWEKETKVSSNFARVINKMLELDVRQRYNSAAEVIKSLELIPYEQELAGAMANLRSSRPQPLPDISHDENAHRDRTISPTTSPMTTQNLAEAIKRRREKRKQANANPQPAPPPVVNPVPPTAQLKPRVQLTPEIVLKDYARGERNFSQQILSEMNLEGVKLARASFSQSKLIGVNLQGADLYKSNFYNANLAQANLREANLQKAELYKANLKNADLQGANLRNSNLTNATLKDANLCGANLKDSQVDEEQLKLAKTNWKTVYPDGKRKWW